MEKAALPLHRSIQPIFTIETDVRYLAAQILKYLLCIAGLCPHLIDKRQHAQIVAIELLAAAHAVELHRPLRPGMGVFYALERLRIKVPRIGGDDAFGEAMEKIRVLILDGYFEEVASWRL